VPSLSLGTRLFDVNGSLNLSGPPYPPLPTDNSLGNFVIGVSPLGTIPPFNYWQTIISQYSNSPILTTLIGNFFQYIDQTANLDSFFDNIWNLTTATGVGLDIWGRIIGVTRILFIPGSQRYFGFDEGTLAYDPWNQSPFYAGAPLTQNYLLNDSAYRTLLYAKALTNISDGSIPSINTILRTLFPNRGNCFVTDGNNMTMTYTFQFVLTAVELAIVQQTGVLPKPVGVKATIVHQ
jgi:hypothetical protein